MATPLDELMQFEALADAECSGSSILRLPIRSIYTMLAWTAFGLIHGTAGRPPTDPLGG